MVKKQATPKKKSASCRAGAAADETHLANKDNNTTTTSAQDNHFTIADQQRLLNHFTAAFSSVLEDPSFPQLLQEIKQALFRRDFAAAFGRDDYLAAYAARWSPTRALCYAEIFRRHLPQHIRHDALQSSPSDEPCRRRRRTRMICIGGCAAEHVAFASYIHHQQARQHPLPPPSSSPSAPSDNDNSDGSGDNSLTLLDSAPWSPVTTALQNTLTSPLPLPLPLSKYASTTTADVLPLLPSPDHLRLDVLQRDALEMSPSQWTDLFIHHDDDAHDSDATTTTVVVVTLMFTLNELYANGGIGKTTRLLGLLGAALPDKALLLVVDSPGSYSETALGKEGKKKAYPMQWLLHHTLTGDAAGGGSSSSSSSAAPGRRWTRLEAHDSLWFRLSDQLTYPIQLENMRYQLHLYRIDKTPEC